MALAAGQRLGPYEIVAPLGAGGMGEVYRGRDVRLDRPVAIKVMAPELASDPERRARFEREARAASALDHPHICAVYDVGQQDGTAYLVMELLAGESLQERLRRGALPIAEALARGVEIADALGRAHREGIVHRDLKPGNVMLTRDGAKLVDFGLARCGQGVEPLAVDSVADTVAGEASLTGHGRLVGTLPYMAPEQLEGREADARADIWAFGCLLFEMLTGRRAFEGGSPASLIGAILKDEPPRLAALVPLASPALERAVRECLVKDREERRQSAADLRRELAWLAGPEATAAPASPPSASRWLWPATLALGLVLVALLALTSLRRAPAPAVVRAALEVPLHPSFAAAALSPDGRRLAYASPAARGGTELRIRSLDGVEARTLPGTEGATMPFWSPDSRAIGFFAGGELKRVDLAGGPPLVLCRAPSGRGGSWSRDTILFAATYRGGLSRVSSRGGAVSDVTALDPALHDFSHRWPQLLPDGRHFLAVALFTDPARGTESHALVTGALDSPRIAVLVPDASNAAYLERGYLLFAREGALLAQRFDAVKLRLSGDVVPVPGSKVAYMKRWGYAEFSAAPDGTVVERSSISAPRQLRWLDRSGKPIRTLGEAGYLRTPRLSPDERRVAFCRFDPVDDEGDIWLYDLVRDTETRVTLRQAYYGAPAFSPDGSAIAFASNLAGVQNLFQKVPGGPTEPELLLGTPLWKRLSDWSADGRLLLYSEQDPRLGDDIWALPLTGSRKPFLVLQTPFEEDFARLSPDGRFVAYQSNQSGAANVYARPLTGGGPEWQVSRAGGDSPSWRADGRELFFVSSDAQLMAVDVKLEPTFASGVPHPLFAVPGIRGSLLEAADYSVSKDGQRFLVAAPTAGTSSTLTLLLNWAPTP